MLLQRLPLLARMQLLLRRGWPGCGSQQRRGTWLRRRSRPLRRYLSDDLAGLESSARGLDLHSLGKGSFGE